MKSVLPIFLCTLSGLSQAADVNPNLVIINIDDLGYAEIGPFGSQLHRTPNLDRMASEGRRLTCFYAAPVCSPSRAALMTGCYPKRVLPIPGVLFPAAAVGLHPNEVTIAEVLKDEGYTTACIGKWHLGDQPEFLPPRQGFDLYYGVPYSNDMGTVDDGSHSSLGEPIPRPKPPSEKRDDDLGLRGSDLPPLPFLENEQILFRVRQDEQQASVRQLTKRAVGFIREHEDEPFFVYLAHSAVHFPLYPGAAFQGRSANGLHGDWVEEVDWSVGQVLDTLRDLNLAARTFVLFTSDNGGTKRGLNTPLRGFKGSTWEGGMREPTIAWWPGRIPAGTATDEIMGMIDVLPTTAHLAGATLPSDRKLDGHNIWPLLAGEPGARSPHKVFYYFRGLKLEAVRAGRWKLHIRSSELYDLEADIGESSNVAFAHPDVVKELEELVAAMDDDLGLKEIGPGCRELGRVPDPKPWIDQDGQFRTPEIPLGVFEGDDLDGWTAKGDAFGTVPFRPDADGHFREFEGKGVAWSGRGGVESTGTMLSPEFKIQRPFINFLIAGARDLPSALGVELLVDGGVVRAGAASEARDPTHALYWRTFNVRDFEGRRARLRVNDRSTTGAVTVDHFAQSQSARGVPSDARTLLGETHRPQFHFTARTGWQNDANGLLHYRGRWHLFHQHRPPGSPVTVWGHAVSGDLVHWRHLPTAIPSDGVYSNFSGSGLVDWENASGLKSGAEAPLLLFYTLRPPGETAVTDGKGERTSQCMAYSLDGGQTFKKFAGNPILRTSDFRDRDPKVFWHAPTRAWRMVLSLSRNNTDREHATYGLFRSADLASWELIQEIGPGSWYWECPDFFELPLDGGSGRSKWVLMKGSGDYIVGSFDGNRFTPATDIIRTKWGGSFYGAQTFSDAPGGRRIQIAWMNCGRQRAPNAFPGMPFNHQMSFPRELTLRSTPAGPRVFREPVAEIRQLYTDTHDVKPRLLVPGDNILAGVHGDLLDVELELELQQATEVILTLRGEEIRYDAKAEKLHAFGRPVPLAPRDGSLILRVLLDRTSIELFGSHGEVTHSGVFFADPANKDLSLSIRGGPAHVRRLTVHELKSIWPQSPTKSQTGMQHTAQRKRHSP